jgi:hypothetical protein
MWRKNYRVEW